MSRVAHSKEHAARTAPLYRALTERRSIRKAPMIKDVVKVKPADACFEPPKRASQHCFGIDFLSQ